MIDVAIRAPSLDMAAEWEELARRAAPNVFMSPVALCAAHEGGFAHINVLLAYDVGAQGRRLVGFWALREINVLPLWPTLLSALPFDYAFVATPVIDPDYLEDVAAAFLAAVEADPTLPKVIRMSMLDGDASPAMAVTKALAARRGAALTLSVSPRPYVTRTFGLKNSGSTRKKLRQEWNRLAGVGEVAVSNERAPAKVRVAFETFLAMEANSWKGEQGTALLSDPEDAALVRRLIGDLAEAGQASVALLSLDGKAIAAQVVLYCGPIAYTWKTAYNSEYAKYSPGMLLIDKLTEQLFAGDVVQEIESCSPNGSFMEQLWNGRRNTVDMLVDVGARKSLTFRTAALGAQGYAALKDLRNRLRAHPWIAAPKKKSLATPR
ncbi:MAG: GNAT family N-acetyltransferase [Variibacter sp.]|nr:GNAT family N-acetyltransferase [Variibacter sp.]